MRATEHNPTHIQSMYNLLLMFCNLPIRHYEVEVDARMHDYLGIQRSLQMEGNSARKLLAEKNIPKVLNSIFYFCYTFVNRS